MDKLTQFLSWVFGLLLLITVFLIMGDIFIVSVKHIQLDFLLESPLSAGRKGGILPIIISTLLILATTLTVIIPVGLATALYFSEYAHSNNIFIQWAKRSIEILSAVPSIVFGLFGNAFFCIYLGFGFSILSGGLTLALMALPLFVVTAERGFRNIPSQHRHAAEALGLSKFTFIKSVLIPYCLPSLFVALVLSLGRSLAETAALIFTSGYVDRMPESIMDSGRALSVHIYDLAMNVPGGDINAYKTSFVLIFLILTLNSFFGLATNLWYSKKVKL